MGLNAQLHVEIAPRAAKQSGIVCGLNFAQEVYYVVEPRVQWMAACTRASLKLALRISCST